MATAEKVPRHALFESLARADVRGIRIVQGQVVIGSLPAAAGDVEISAALRDLQVTGNVMLVPVLQSNQAAREHAVPWHAGAAPTTRPSAQPPLRPDVKDRLDAQSSTLAALDNLSARQAALDEQARQLSIQALRTTQEASQAHVERLQAQHESALARVKSEYEVQLAQQRAEARLLKEEVQEGKLRLDRQRDESAEQLNAAVDKAVARAMRLHDDELSAQRSTYMIERTSLMAQIAALEQRNSAQQARIEQLERESDKAGDHWRRRALEAETSVARLQAAAPANRKVEEIRALSEVLRGADASTRDAVLQVMHPNRAPAEPPAVVAALNAMEQSPLVRAVVTGIAAQRAQRGSSARRPARVPRAAMPQSHRPAPRVPLTPPVAPPSEPPQQARPPVADEEPI